VEVKGGLAKDHSLLFMALVMCVNVRIGRPNMVYAAGSYG
jgi:hypothetical protein